MVALEKVLREILDGLDRGTDVTEPYKQYWELKGADDILETADVLGGI